MKCLYKFKKIKQVFFFFTKSKDGKFTKKRHEKESKEKIIKKNSTTLLHF